MNRVHSLALMALFAAATAAPAEIVAHSVTYKAADGTTLKGYVAYDSRLKAPTPTVLVYHDWDGLGDYEQMRCREIAQFGYVAFAPDIYGLGAKVDTTAEKSALIGKYLGNLGLFHSRIKSGYNAMLQQKLVDPKQVVAIGYCFGGASALETMRYGLPLKGVVTFHGSVLTTKPLKKGVFHGKVLVLAGAADPFVTKKDVETFHQEMKNAGVPVGITFYPGVKHAFTVKGVESQGVPGLAYDAHADAESWKALIRFLRTTVRR